ncbi:LURP-one-related 4 [Spatholobus suberectus]|nr:LURP-one-related 4 [Spatholobus suberectus]
MAKVYPQEPTSSPCMSYGRETYTLWLKSLVFHSNGCTVYDSNGVIVYRVDNYDTKGRRDVNLLDLRGRVLCTIHKRLLAFGRWDVYRCSDSNCKTQEKPWFQVKRCYKIITRKVTCQITVECQKYCIEKTGGKTAFRIVDIDGDIVADAKQKHSSSGVVLGNDVLSLDVEGGIDHALIMAFVTVFGLICGRM